MAAEKDQKDRWNAQAYQASASFMPKLATKVFQWLDPRPSDKILDLGCGDGILTAQIAGIASSGRVTGLDASASMIQTAQNNYERDHPNLAFRVQDCARLLETEKDNLNGSWDKVFSNAALHWILANPDTRPGVFEAVHKALKPGGTFVFEMGGAGNVAEMDTILIAALVAHGIPLAEAKATRPWFFPSENWMQKTLTDAGFEVEKIEKEYRPTKMTEIGEDGQGGLPGWVRLMGAAVLEKVEEGRREEVLKWILGVLEPVVTREEDGSVWVGYVRLRALARKM